jgi:L-cysteine/cystine lyase
VPFAELPGEVAEGTRLVACSHVSWVGGEVMDVAALRATGVPILLDAAQALGAIPVDVHELGVDFYAGSGQKWMCGPEGSGALYVHPDRLDELEPPFPGYMTVADHDDPLGSELADTTARLDDGFPSAFRSTWALASMTVLAGAGWAWVHDRASSGADQLAELLSSRGHQVAPRGRSTLVSWKADDADGDVSRLAAQGIIVRSIPSAGLVRASVGAWTSEEELQRLAELA